LINPQMTKAMIAKMIAPTTAKPAMTPPLRPASLDDVAVTPVA